MPSLLHMSLVSPSDIASCPKQWGNEHAGCLLPRYVAHSSVWLTPLSPLEGLVQVRVQFLLRYMYGYI